MSRFSLALAALALLIAGCDSGGPTPEDIAAVYVFNQGQFGNDNSGGITTWDPVNQQTGRLNPPGGLTQGGLVSDGQLYVLLNFSSSSTDQRGLVNVVDLATGNVLRQFEVGTPRGIAITGGTAFVSNYFSDTVTPVDLTTGTAGTPIAVGSGPEGVALSGGRVFVANSGGFDTDSTLSVIDPASRAVTETVQLGCKAPNEVVADDDGEIWVVCTGRSDFTTGEVTAPGQVVVLDASSLEVVERFTFSGLLGGAALGQDAAFDPDGDALYVLQSRFGVGSPDTVYRFNTRRNSREAQLSLLNEDASGIGFGGGQLYIGRVNALNPFSDDGFVSVHDAGGEEVARFDAGIAPAAFAFADAR